MKAVSSVIGIIATGLVVIFGLNLFGFANFAFFAPKYEGVRRDVMIESRAYSEATVRELYRLKRQYQAAEDPAARAAIAAAARHEFNIFPQERLPHDLRVWMVSLNNQ
ncbi:hypothetical protein [Pyruvatibacter mobilis]|uniref:hypothetical protein n=1 Tax=Pyruvatibacter mobilis TaxID=1712261 RepID=UPI003BB0E7BB